MVKLSNVSPTHADSLIMQGWIPSTLYHYYPSENLAYQRNDYFRADTTERTTKSFGIEYRDQVSPCIHDLLDYTPTQDPSAWANQLITIEGIEKQDREYLALTGIRYRGQNLKRPFVDVILTDLPLNAKHLAVFTQALLQKYETFRPVCVRFFIPDCAHLILQDLRGISTARGSAIDMHLVSGTLAELCERPRPHTYHRVRLTHVTPAQASEASQEARKIYMSIASQNKNLWEWAQPQSQDSFENTAQQGLCWKIYVDHQPAGFLALDRRGEQGIEGFSVEELCLDAPFRGQKLGNSVLRHGLENLLLHPAANSHDTLWGTIHPDNLPSLHNALSLGRTILGSYIWVGEKVF